MWFWNFVQWLFYTRPSAAQKYTKKEENKELWKLLETIDSDIVRAMERGRTELTNTDTSNLKILNRAATKLRRFGYNVCTENGKLEIWWGE